MLTRKFHIILNYSNLIKRCTSTVIKIIEIEFNIKFNFEIFRYTRKIGWTLITKIRKKLKDILNKKIILVNLC